MITFEELGVDRKILDAITELGFESAMPVQAEVLPVLLSTETDLVALAQTGTGKTAAFGIPTIQKLDYSNNDTEALVLCPTRELCMQITKDITNYAKYLPQASVVAVYGGSSIELQKKALRKGAKIIVATPGRMIDLLKRGYANISKIRWVILDEADEMLDMGFKEDLDQILSATPTEKKTLLFSATMPIEVERIARTYMKKPVEITIGTRNSSSENVKHYYYLVHARERYSALKRIADYYPNIYSIVFCRTRAETQEVANALIKDGYNADALHGDLSQAQRDHVMNRFRCKNLQMLVATDVAARGLDVNDLTHVINYNLPDETEQYNHRSGRTGRAGKSGIAISILNLREKHKIREIEKIIGKKFVQAKIPTGKEVCEKQLFNMIENVEKVEVNEKEITDFLPVIYQKFEHLDKEELIRRFVSIEFNRFLDYYRLAPDLNVDESREREYQEREKADKKNSRQPKDNRGFVRLFISLGHRDKILPQRIIGLINDMTHNREIVIGRIDIMDAFSYVDITEQYAQEVIEAFDDIKYKGRPLTVEIAKPTTESSSSGRGFGRSEKSGSRNESRGGNRSGGASRRSDDDRPKRRDDDRPKRSYGSKDSSSRSGGGDKNKGKRW